MRYELTDDEWVAIKLMLPNKPRGVPRVNDRRVLNGIFWVLRSGAPWRDLPDNFGPYTTCYNRFVRWHRDPSPRRSIRVSGRGRERLYRRIRLHCCAPADWRPTARSPRVRAYGIHALRRVLRRRREMCADGC